MLSSLKFWAVIMGLFFILEGIAGCMPQFTTNGMLFGIFMVNTLLNVVHIVMGVIFILAATNSNYAKFIFRLFGLLLLALAIVGFVHNGDLYLVHFNMANNILVLSLSIVNLFFGFVFKTKSAY